MSLSIHDEIFSKQSLKNIGYILPKTLVMDTLGQMETAKNDFRMLEHYMRGDPKIKGI